MSDVYLWDCVCGTSGRGEKAAQEHAKTCHRFGWPKTNPYVAAQLGKR